MMMMGSRCFRTVLLLALFLSLSSSQGFGRRVKVVRHNGSWPSHQPLPPNEQKRQEKLDVAEKSKSGAAAGAEEKEAVAETTMDYEYPKANTNPRNGAAAFVPPPSTPAPPPQVTINH